MTTQEKTAFQFKCPFTCIIAGAAGSGKTTLLFEILRHGMRMFSAEPKQIIYGYDIYQKLYDDMKMYIPHIRVNARLPFKDDSEAWSAEQPRMKVLVFRASPKGGKEP